MSDVAERLRRGGCVAANEEAALLLRAARSGDELERAIARRLAGEPLAWIVGRTTFCGLELFVDPGVYVPRWQSEVVAERAAAALPDDGVALDLCCGSGAIAAVLQARRPSAHVIAVDIDEVAVECARRNGVDAFVGDLFGPVPRELRGTVDVVVAVTPYVPAGALPLVARTDEPRRALDGGPDGLHVLTRVVRDGVAWLRPGGTFAVEIGGPQVAAVRHLLGDAGYTDMSVLRDADGDVSGMSARSPIR